MGILFNRREEISDFDMRQAVAQKEMKIAFRDAENNAKVDAAVQRNAAFQKKFNSGIKFTEKQTARVVGQSAEAVGVAMQQGRPTFSREQAMLGEMFGQGEKIWGTNNNPVTINNDLNSGRSDPWDETGSMFGNGPFGERSGLF